jgi:hypothetical protein
LQIKDSNRETIYIRNISSQKAHKSLGYQQSAFKLQKHQIEWVTQKLRASMINLLQSNFTYKEAMMYYRHIHKAKIKYPITLSSIPASTAQKLTNYNMSETLNMLGFSSKTPRGIVFGHHSLGGLEMLDIELEQVTRNLIWLVKSFNGKSQNSELMMTALKWWWYYKGTYECPVQSKIQHLDKIESEWFKALTKFIHKYEIKLQIPTNYLQYQRVNDEFLMALA